MPVDSATNCWVPSLFPKQFEVFNSSARYLLVSGPRKSGKTIAALHRVVRHLWTVDGARVALFAKTMKSAKDGGVWSDLVKIVLPEWFEADIGMEFTSKDGAGNPGPKMDNLTKTTFFKVSNYHGGQSELFLFSLDHDEEVEAKVKSLRFSMIYFSELANFYNRLVFAVSMPQLRMENARPPIRREDHQWIADTNPSDEGEESWIYKIWYQDRVLDLDTYTDEDFETKFRQKKEDFRSYQDNIELVEIFCRDNPYYTKQDEIEIKSLCNYDNDLYDRYVNGLWHAGGNQERHFADAFNSSVHVVGNLESHDEKEWETIIPTQGCVELVTGWDLGDVHCSAHIVETILPPQGLKGQNLSTTFNVLDELVVVDERVSMEEFVDRILEMMDNLERIIGHKVSWRHWSDSSSLNKYKAQIGGMESMLIYQLSDGRINLTGVPREPGSVRHRVKLLKRLLLSNRLCISAQCKSTIRMFKELRTDKRDFIKRSNNPHKHPFDSLSYCLQMECVNELESWRPQVASRGGLILAP